MKNIIEHCHDDNFELLVDLFNANNVLAFSDVNWNYKKLKDKDITYFMVFINLKFLSMSNILDVQKNFH